MSSVFLPADILLPENANMAKWSVIACDQFTSDKSYWERADEFVGDAPSTLRMIVPEAYLKGLDPAKAAAERNKVMRDYCEAGIFETLSDSMIYVERTSPDGTVRRGLVGKLDLDAYSYEQGTQSPVRATERTVVERIPTRVAIREDALLELPHVMTLIDDVERTVIEPLTAIKDSLRKVYDFDLMEGGGHIAGWQVTGVALENVKKALSAFESRPVQIVIGDGNHSLAAAKACREKLRGTMTEAEANEHPSRWALVELNNVYDEGISFMAIHRVLFGIDEKKLVSGLKSRFNSDDGYVLTYSDGSESGEFRVPAESVGGMIREIQAYLDSFMAENGGTIDYVHDDDAALKMAEGAGCASILLPAMAKSDLFATVETGKVFPQKSFSIGSAREKRYYLECRKIR